MSPEQKKKVAFIILGLAGLYFVIYFGWSFLSRPGMPEVHRTDMELVCRKCGAKTNVTPDEYDAMMADESKVKFGLVGGPRSPSFKCQKCGIFTVVRSDVGKAPSGG